MDGNGRWALRRETSRSEGHRKGVESVRDVVKACLKNKVGILSLFAFGQDNWKRPKDEVDFLMALFAESIEKELEALHKEGVCVKFIGNITALDDVLKMLIHSLESLTAGNTKLKLNLFVNYSGRWDILEASRLLARRVAQGEISADEIEEDTFSSALSTKALPDPDLFIRTSGEQRISNFLLWQLVYTEFYFPEVHWPDFSVEDFEKALAWFSQRERRYGLTSKQVIEVDNA